MLMIYSNRRAQPCRACAEADPEPCRAASVIHIGDYAVYYIDLSPLCGSGITGGVIAPASEHAQQLHRDCGRDSLLLRLDELRVVRVVAHELRAGCVEVLYEYGVALRGPLGDIVYVIECSFGCREQRRQCREGCLNTLTSCLGEAAAL